MMRALAAHGLAFLSGAAAAGTALWLWLGGEVPSPRGNASDMPLAPPDAERAAATTADFPSATEEPSAARVARIVAAALPEIRASDDRERAAHVGLLMKQLEREGAAGVEAMIALLATGEDWPLGPLVKTGGISIVGAKSLRAALLVALARSPEPAAWPVCRAAATLDLQRTDSAETAIDRLTLLEQHEPGAHRADAIAAMLRVWAGPNTGWNPDMGGTFHALHVMAHYGAAELLPLVEAEALQRPGVHLHDYIGALWSLPAATREQAMQRLLANDSTLAELDKFPSLQKLDYRIAKGREFAVGWFSSAHLATEKAREIEMLGKTDHWGPTNRLIYSAEPPKPIAGTPGTAEQTRVRLALLDEISPHCPDPLLQQKIAEARASLLQKISARPH